MPRLVLPVLLLVLAGAAGAGCGENRYAAGAPELGPEHYAIAPDDVPEDGRFIRYAAPGPDRPGGLDVAVTELRSNQGGVPVTLVGAVHVADAPFFDAVQRELDRHAVVLYEGVKPEHMNVADWQDQTAGSGGRTAELQRTLAGWFGFEYQLEGIDYTRPTFVHADMSLEAFLEAGGGRLVSVGTESADPDVGVPGSEGAGPQAGRGTEAGNLGADAWKTWQAVKGFGDLALGRPGPLRSLARRMFAETLGTLDMGRSLALRPDVNELVLMKRNEVVVERLREVLPGATGPIAIFYGAAHMPDLQRRLTEELGYVRAAGRWIRAWAVRPPLAP